MRLCLTPVFPTGERISPSCYENSFRMKYIWKLIYFLLVAFSGMAFMLPHPMIRVLDATSQTWTAGIAGGGSGINYALKVVILKNKKITFDSAWVNGQAFKIQVIKGAVYNPNPVLNQHDTVILRFSDEHPGRIPVPGEAPAQAMAKPTVKQNFNVPGKIFISYFANNRKQIYTAGPIRKLEPENRP
jgi:hypothetical protein